MCARADFDRLSIVLVATRNPLNIGAAARAMSNFGFSRLRVVNPYQVAWREARSAVGGAPVLHKAQEFNSVAKAITDCSLVVGTSALTNRDPQQPVRALPEGARLIRKHLASGSVALLFGSEKRGLSNDDLSYCRWVLHIPTVENHASINLGQAVAVSLYELANLKMTSRAAARVPRASGKELERMSELLQAMLRAAGYAKAERPGAEQKLRRLIRRLDWTSADAQTFLGMLRAIGRKRGN